MQAFTQTQPFFHTIYVGTAAERAGITTHEMLDTFYETDTGDAWRWGGLWQQVIVNGIEYRHGITDPLPPVLGWQQMVNLYFSNGENGVIYPLNPAEGCVFQNSAGTTPCTGPNQPVGLALDVHKSLALGPELVVNGDFSAGTTGWIAVGTGSISVVGGELQLNVGTTPNYGAGFRQNSIIPVPGKSYRVTFTFSAPVSDRRIRVVLGGVQVYTGPVSISKTTFTAIFSSVNSEPLVIYADTVTSDELFYFDNISVKLLAGNHARQPTTTKRPMLGREPFGGRRNLLLNTDALSTQNITVTATPYTLKFTGAGTVALSGASTMVASGAGTYTFTPSAGTLTLTVVGTVTFAQAELGSTATPYQKVVSSFDVTEAGVPEVWYIKGDQIDDGANTAPFAMGSDKLTVWGGVKKISDAALGTVCGTDPVANAGAFALYAPPAAASTVGYTSKGTLASQAVATGLVAPVTAAYTCHSDIAADVSTISVNGGAAFTSAADQGTGSYGNLSLFLLSQDGVSGFTGSQLYSLMVRGAYTSDADSVAGTEYTLDLSGVTLPTFVARYAYSTPVSGTIPTAGQLIHSDNVINKWNISRTDLDGKVITGDFLENGDTMVLNGVAYTLEAEQFFADYISLTIEPTTQQPDGTYSIAVYT